MSVREKKLEQAEEEADKLWSETYGEEEPLEEDDESKVDKSEEEAVDDVEDKDDTDKDETDDDAPQKSSDDTWEHKFKTLTGKYNAEVPRLASEAKHWKENSIVLSQRISELEEKLNSMTIESASRSNDSELERLVEDYPDIGQYLKKRDEAHRAEIDAITRKFQEQLDGSLADVKRDVSTSKQDAFDKDMASLGVPDWREIDNMEEFSEWLQEPAGYGRYPKAVLLEDAARALDAKACAKFFLDFKEQIASRGSADTQARLKSHIAPPKNDQGGKPRSGGSAKTLTQEMYTQFMRDSAKGKFNPADWNGKTEQQVEAMFDVAIASGNLK